MNDFYRYRRAERRRAIILAIGAWAWMLSGVIVLTALLWLALVGLLTMGPAA